MIGTLAEIEAARGPVVTVVHGLTGSLVTRGTVVDCDADEVTLRLRDGSEVTIPRYAIHDIRT